MTVKIGVDQTHDILVILQDRDPRKAVADIFAVVFDGITGLIAVFLPDTDSQKLGFLVIAHQTETVVDTPRFDILTRQHQLKHPRETVFLLRLM